MSSQQTIRWIIVLIVVATAAALGLNWYFADRNTTRLGWTTPQTEPFHRAPEARP